MFVRGIGGPLGDGLPHDARSSDYDDWSSPMPDGLDGLNGDILIYNPVLDSAFEISSMGIRVNPEALERQLAFCGNQERCRAEYGMRPRGKTVLRQGCIYCDDFVYL